MSGREHGELVLSGALAWKETDAQFSVSGDGFIRQGAPIRPATADGPFPEAPETPVICSGFAAAGEGLDDVLENLQSVLEGVRGTASAGSFEFSSKMALSHLRAEFAEEAFSTVLRSAGSGRYRKDPQNPHRIFVVRVYLLAQLVVVCWYVSSRTGDVLVGKRLSTK